MPDHETYKFRSYNTFFSYITYSMHMCVCWLFNKNVNFVPYIMTHLFLPHTIRCELAEEVGWCCHINRTQHMAIGESQINRKQNTNPFSPYFHQVIAFRAKIFFAKKIAIVSKRNPWFGKPFIMPTEWRFKKNKQAFIFGAVSGQTECLDCERFC